MVRKLMNNYQVCVDFKRLHKRENIQELAESKTNTIKDLEITPFLIDTSNFNTMLVKISDKARKINRCVWRF